MHLRSAQWHKHTLPDIPYDGLLVYYTTMTWKVHWKQVVSGRWPFACRKNCLAVREYFGQTSVSNRWYNPANLQPESCCDLCTSFFFTTTTDCGEGLASYPCTGEEPEYMPEMLKVETPLYLGQFRWHQWCPHYRGSNVHGS